MTMVVIAAAAVVQLPGPGSTALLLCGPRVAQHVACAPLA
jgi:hypothetical protein